MFSKALTISMLLASSLSANAALYDRGNGMIYDDVLDITWLQDANYAHTSGYAAANATGGLHSDSYNIQADGRMGWTAANTWANQLVYGGYDDWRLPSARLITPYNPCYADDGSCDQGYNNTTGELGYMFYTNLGNAGQYDTNGSFQNGSGLLNAGFTDATDNSEENFLNTHLYNYWLHEFYTPQNYLTWSFQTITGRQDVGGRHNSGYAWAVRTGDVSQVPVPAAVWLFGSVLIGLAGIKRKKLSTDHSIKLPSSEVF